MKILPNVSLVMLQSSSGQRAALRPEEDRCITVETLARFSSTFKLLPENCVFNMLHQPAEKPPFNISAATYVSGKFCMATFCPPSFNIMHKVYCTKLAMCYILMIMTYPFDVTLVLPRIYVLHANLVYLGYLLLRLQGQDPMHMSV